MANKSKAKGTSYESSLLPFLKLFDPLAERRTLSGALDKGDFVTPKYPIAWEAKNRRTMKLNEWIKEAQVEAKNLGVAVGVVVHKRFGKTAPEEQFVTLTLGDFMKLLDSNK